MPNSVEVVIAEYLTEKEGSAVDEFKITAPVLSEYAGNAGASGVAWAVETKVYDIKNATLRKDAPISRALAATLLYNFAKVFGE